MKILNKNIFYAFALIIIGFLACKKDNTSNNSNLKDNVTSSEYVYNLATKNLTPSASIAINIKSEIGVKFVYSYLLRTGFADSLINITYATADNERDLNINIASTAFATANMNTVSAIKSVIKRLDNSSDEALIKLTSFQPPLPVLSNFPVSKLPDANDQILIEGRATSETGLDSEKLKKGKLMPHEWEQLNAKVTTLSESPLYIDDTPGLSVFELRSKARQLCKKHGIKIIIIDYLQLMNAGGKDGGNRQEEISIISRSLKVIAKELSIPVIALSQLSRAVETRGGDKRPMLSDLRESGAIEQDADMVMFIYRPEYYGITEGEGGINLKGIGEIIVAKHRNGELRNIPLRFIADQVKFTDLETSEIFQSAPNNNFNNAGENEEEDDFHPRSMTFPSKFNNHPDDLPF